MPGFVLDGCARLAAGFQDAAATIRGDDLAEDDRPGSGGPYSRQTKNLYRAMHQVPIAPPLIVPTSGAGGVVINDLMGPNTGFHWSVRRLMSTGYTAGTIQVYRNAVQTGFGASFAVVGELMFTFPQAGTYTFGRGEILLEPDDTMVITATGLTLSAGVSGVTVYGAADQFESWLLPDYLM